MKIFLLFFSFWITNNCTAQKYILLDKQMILPIVYANNITPEQTYRGMFPVEKSSIKRFLQEVEKISKHLTGKTEASDAFEFTVGCTTFRGLKVPLKDEERLDVVLQSKCGNSKISMHLSDSKSSNSKNAFYINTWLKYIRGSLKITKS